MGINLVIAVTDGDWFDMLRQQPNLCPALALAPAIVEAILDGRQPADMTLAALMRPFAVGWQRQAASLPPSVSVCCRRPR